MKSNKKKIIAIDSTLAINNYVGGIANVCKGIREAFEGGDGFEVINLFFDSKSSSYLICHEIKIENNKSPAKKSEFLKLLGFVQRLLAYLLFSALKAIFNFKLFALRRIKHKKCVSLYQYQLTHYPQNIPLKKIYDLVVKHNRSGTKKAYLEAKYLLEKNISYKFQPVDFKAIDCFFLAGISWDQNFDYILKQKKQHQFKLGVLIYDLTPIRNPNTSCAGKHFQQFICDAISGCDFLVTDSEYVRQDILNFANESGKHFDQSKIKSVLLAANGIKDEMKSNAQENILDSYKLVQNRYAIIVSTIEPRKNHRLLIQIWRELLANQRSHIIPLVIVGNYGWLINDLKTELENDFHLQKYLILTGSIEDKEKCVLLQNARFSLFPSFAEGFGLPIAESLQMGTPAISSNNTSMPEAGQGLAEMIDVMDSKKWYETILKYIQDDDLINEKRLEIGNVKLRQWCEFKSEITNTVKSYI